MTGPTGPRQYRRRGEIVEAVQFTGDNERECAVAWSLGKVETLPPCVSGDWFVIGSAVGHYSDREWNSLYEPVPLPEPAPADGWVRVEEGLPEHGATVLTINALDLYPVAAFCFDPGTEETIWLRETEGPEDVAIDGRHEPLYRHPTHWRPLPAPPVVEGGK